MRSRYSASQTALTARQIFAVVLVLVVIIATAAAWINTVKPSSNDIEGSYRTAIISGVIAALAMAWLVKLAFDAARDRRRGVARRPARVSGWFHVIFGGAVAATGIVCSLLSLSYASSYTGGVWTLYYGMILWGLVQAIIGLHRVRESRPPRFR